MKIKLKKSNIREIILLPALVFVFLTMYYWDNQTIFLTVLNVVSDVFSGKWQSLFNGWGLPYGLLIQLGAAIWSLPIYILSEFGALGITSVVARLWYKLFVLLFLLADTHLLGKIAGKVGINAERTSWIKLYFLSSLIVILPAVHVAQLEAVYLFFILLGIYYYLEEEHIKFLVCFLIANPSKYMPLFVFIPLVLLREKKYFYIIRDLIIGMLGILADKVIKSVGYRIGVMMNQNAAENTNKALQDADSFIDNSITNLLSGSYSVFSVSVSLVFACFFILCIWCYLRPKETDRGRNAIYVSFLGFLFLFAFGAITPYWIILLVPFELLLIFKGTDETDRLLIPLEIMMAVAFVYTSLQSTCWVYGSADTFSMLLFSWIPGYVDSPHGYIKDFLTYHDIDGFASVMGALMVAASGAIAYMCNPKKQVRVEEQEPSNIYVRGWYWIRVAILYVWIFLNVFVVAMGRV